MGRHLCYNIYVWQPKIHENRKWGLILMHSQSKKGVSIGAHQYQLVSLIHTNSQLVIWIMRWMHMEISSVLNSLTIFCVVLCVPGQENSRIKSFGSGGSCSFLSS